MRAWQRCPWCIGTGRAAQGLALENGMEVPAQSGTTRVEISSAPQRMAAGMVCGCRMISIVLVATGQP